jgi:hypothetical protein
MCGLFVAPLGSCPPFLPGFSFFFRRFRQSAANSCKHSTIWVFFELGHGIFLIKVQFQFSNVHRKMRFLYFLISVSDAVVVLPYFVCKFSWLLGHFCSGLIPLMWTKTFGMLLAVCGRWLRCLPLRLESMVTPSVTSWQSISLLARNLRILSPLPTIVMW